MDIEADALVNPTNIWLIVCKDIDTGECHIFRNLNENVIELSKFKEFAKGVTLWIGHNILGYDCPVMVKLIDVHLQLDQCLDTLILSKLIDYSRLGHSVEDYGLEFGIPKGKFVDFSKYSQEMEDYCVRDVDICHRIYLKYLRYLSNPIHAPSISLEHSFQLVVNDLHTNGFSFNSAKATTLLARVEADLAILDKDILTAFPPRLRLIREITPKATKYGTISLTSIPKELRECVSDLSVGASFSYCGWNVFNPSSHKQIVSVLNDSGWKPTDRTQTHIDTERELARIKFQKGVDLRKKELIVKLTELKKTGWKVNEANLETLPAKAPAGARTLAKRILLEARRRTLTEWLGLVEADGRIHGRFQGIGAWTHRMSHQNPNTANIPNEFDTAGKKKLLGKELRSLWQAPRNRLLVGVDAEGIQLRIFAHLINDPEFTRALVEGKKDDKTDPHSLNQSILGSVCKSRQAAKRFIYALLLGAGMGKLSEILGCGDSETKEALDRLMGRYTGWQTLKDEVFPKDAKRGWFVGLDGRRVRIPGETESSRKHLAMSGYLQSGEAIVMKRATLKWVDNLRLDGALLVNFVHDEWQTECPNDMNIAIKIAQRQADSLREVGEEMKLHCPLAGSYWNDDHKDYTVHTNWSMTH